jgi:uncharacterized membrane protein
MNKILKKLKWLPLQIIIVVSFIGLALSGAGLVFEQWYLYKLGLKLSALLYIVVLPVCILLVALFPIAGCYVIIEKIRKSLKEKGIKLNKK